MDPVPNICRICISLMEDGEGTKYNSGFVTDMLRICIPQMNQSLFKSSLVCSHCMSKLNQHHNFKMRCLLNESKINSLTELTNNKTTRICWTCLDYITEGFIDIYDEIYKYQKNLTKRMVEICISNINVKTTNNLSMCLKCVTQLKEYYRFYKKCRTVETKIVLFSKMGNVNFHDIKDFKSEFCPSTTINLDDDESSLNRLLVNNKKPILDDDPQQAPKLHNEEKQMEIILIDDEVEDTALCEGDYQDIQCGGVLVKNERLTETNPMSPNNKDQVEVILIDDDIEYTSLSGDDRNHQDVQCLRQNDFENDCAKNIDDHKIEIVQHEITCEESKYLKPITAAHGKCTEDLEETMVHAKSVVSQIGTEQQISNHEGIMRCQLCNYFSHSVSELSIHQSTIHYKFQCKKCNFRSLSEYYLKLHVASMHISESSQSSRIYRCNQCNYGSNMRSYFEIHLAGHESQNGSALEAFSSSDRNSMIDLTGNMDEFPSLHINNNAKEIKCPECEYTSYDQQVLVNHKLQHFRQNLKRVKISKCKVVNCGFVTSKEALLKAHLLKHYGIDTIDVDACGRNQSSGNFQMIQPCEDLRGINVVDTIEAHGENRSFGNLGDLHSQMQHPITEIPKSARYQCFDCNFSTSRKTKLKLHVLVHIKEKSRIKHRQFQVTPVSSQHAAVSGVIQSVLPHNPLSNDSVDNIDIVACGRNKSSGNLHLFQPCEYLHGSNVVNTIEDAPGENQSCEKLGGIQSQMQKVTEIPKSPRYQCFECNFSTTRKTKLELHVQVHIKKKSLRKYRKHKTLIQSVIPYNPMYYDSDATINEPYNCENENDTNVRSRISKNKGGDMNKLKQFQCQCCDFSTIGEKEYKNHLNKHEPDPDFSDYSECSSDDGSSGVRSDAIDDTDKSSESELSDNASNGKVGNNEFCSGRSRRQNYLATSQASYEPNRLIFNFFCTKCTYKTCDQTDITTHAMNLHGLQTKIMYRCTECSFSSVDPYILNGHMLEVHEAVARKSSALSQSIEQPEVAKVRNEGMNSVQFRCNICDMVSETKDLLLTHLREVHEMCTGYA